MFEFFSFNKSKKTLELKKCNFTKTQTLKNNKYLNLFKQSVLSCVALIFVYLSPLQRANAIVELGMMVSRPQECLSFFSQSIKTQEAIQTPRAILLATPKASLQQPQQVLNASQVQTVDLENTESNQSLNAGSSQGLTSSHVTNVNYENTNNPKNISLPITNVYQALTELKKITSSYEKFKAAMDRLAQLSKDQKALVVHMQKLEEKFSSLRESVEKQSKITDLNYQYISQSLRSYDELYKILSELKLNYDLLSNQGSDYVQKKLNEDNEELKSLIAQVQGLKDGTSTKALIQDEILFLSKLSRLDEYLNSFQSVQNHLYQYYSLMMVQKGQLLMEVRKYTDTYKKYEDSAIMELDSQLGPSNWAASGAENFTLEFEFGVKETVFGFKPIFIPKGQRTHNKNIATLNPNVSIMGVSRGTFFKMGEKLIAVVGFFPDSTVLVDVINPKKNKSKLKRMKLTDLKGYEEIPTSGFNRPLIYGDAFYLDNKKYLLGKTQALDQFNIQEYNKEALRDRLAKPSIISMFGGVSIPFVISSGIVDTHAAGLGYTVFAMTIGPLINEIRIRREGFTPQSTSRFFEFADGAHHQLNDYSKFLRSQNLTLDISELSKKDSQIVNASAIELLSDFATSLLIARQISFLEENEKNNKLTYEQLRDLAINELKTFQEMDFAVSIDRTGQVQNVDKLINLIEALRDQSYLYFEEDPSIFSSSRSNESLGIPKKIHESLSIRLSVIYKQALLKQGSALSKDVLQENINNFLNYFSKNHSFQEYILFALISELKGNNHSVDYYSDKLLKALESFQEYDENYLQHIKSNFELILNELLGMQTTTNLLLGYKEIQPIDLNKIYVSDPSAKQPAKTLLKKRYETIKGRDLEN